MVPEGVDGEVDAGIEPRAEAGESCVELLNRWSVESVGIFLQGCGASGFGKEMGQGMVVANKTAEACGELTQLSVGGAGDDLLEIAPGLAPLNGTVPGVFLAGVFGGGILQEKGQPALNGEGVAMERIVLMFGERIDLGRSFEKRERRVQGDCQVDG
jgi:hypothetical protein